MTSVVLDREATTRFESVSDRAEVLNDKGRLIGYFVPIQPGPVSSVPFTDEELARFSAEPGGRSLAEILNDLQSQP